MRVNINIDVPDLGPAVTFYRDAIGLTLTRILDGDVAEMTGASCALYLLQKDAGSAASQDSSASRHYDRHWTPVHIDFVVDNLGDAVKRAIDAGAKQESGCIEWMGSRCMTFSDPFGHGFCLIEFDGETYDASV